MSQQFHLVNESVKQNAINYIRQLPVDSKRPLILDVKESTRTAIQNRKMWPLLKDLSDQVLWFGNKYDSDDWKDLITALVAKTKKQEQRMAPGLDGGVVMFGQRTSKMTIPQMVSGVRSRLRPNSGNNDASAMPAASARPRIAHKLTPGLVAQTPTAIAITTAPGIASLRNLRASSPR